MVRKKTIIFWNKTPCSLAKIYQYFQRAFMIKSKEFGLGRHD
jgi:hypothetical protein